MNHHIHGLTPPLRINLLCLQRNKHSFLSLRYISVTQAFHSCYKVTLSSMLHFCCISVAFVLHPCCIATLPSRFLSDSHSLSCYYSFSISFSGGQMADKCPLILSQIRVLCFSISPPVFGLPRRRTYQPLVQYLSCTKSRPHKVPQAPVPGIFSTRSPPAQSYVLTVWR